MSAADDPKREAVKTYVEQTKLLVTLASAFVVAPAAAAITLARVSAELFVWAEMAFVFSVLSGYVVLATIAGSQHQGVFNVHRTATRNASLIQLVLFLTGLVLFVALVVEAIGHPPAGTK